MVNGYVLVEGMRVGARLENLPLQLRKIERYRVPAAASQQPDVWTTVEFEFVDGDADAVAAALAEVLLKEGGWYTNFTLGDDVVVIFAGRIFRYRRGDGTSRAEAAAYGRSAGVPEAQLDWAE